MSQENSAPMMFAILCVGRCGSELLVSLLDSHPEIRCYGELFGKDPPREAFAFSGFDDPQEYLDDLASRSTEPAFGFKLPLSSISAYPDAVKTLDGLRIIRLTRENVVAQHLSGILAFKTGRWKQHTGTESYGDVRHRPKPKKLLQALEALEERERRVDRLARGHPTIALTYERLTSEPIDDIQRFVGVEPRPLSSPYRKLRTRPMSDVIENWDEVVAELRGTRFERFVAGGPRAVKVLEAAGLRE
jgi:LPS sulfotransferase NodH